MRCDVDTKAADLLFSVELCDQWLMADDSMVATVRPRRRRVMDDACTEIGIKVAICEVAQ